MFHTQTEAKRFFANRVIQQASAEGVGLSRAEREMLLWSESDPDFTPEPGLVSELEAEMSDEDYEAKISGLLARGFAVDLAADPGAGGRWQQARAVLEEGDHYILMMIDRALGAKAKPWWQFWR